MRSARPLARGMMRFMRGTFVYEDFGNFQVIDVCAFVVLSVSNGRFQHFLHQNRSFFLAESQDVQSLVYGLPANWSATKRAFWAEVRA
jgi:hypothetical protein